MNKHVEALRSKAEVIEDEQGVIPHVQEIIDIDLKNRSISSYESLLRLVSDRFDPSQKDYPVSAGLIDDVKKVIDVMSKYSVGHDEYLMRINKSHVGMKIVCTSRQTDEVSVDLNGPTKIQRVEKVEF